MRMQERTSAKAPIFADDLAASGKRLNNICVDSLKINLAVALTFSRIAMQAWDREKRLRNYRSASEAYENVLGLVDRPNLTHDDTQIVNHNLERLRSELLILREAL